MEILVLLKHVPATETAIEIADDGVSIKTDNLKWVINPYDEIAVEEALRIKEALGGAVTILSVGSQKAVEGIRTALAMGADQGVLIDDPLSKKCDALGIARILATATKDIAFDLIIAGQRAVDDDNFQVGAAVAEMLKIPSVSLVFKEEISDGKMICHKSIDGGAAVIETSLPALITTQRGLNEPRYTSLPGIMKAKKKPLAIKTLADIGLDASTVEKTAQKIVAMRFPPERNCCKMIEGDSAREKAVEIVRVLHKEVGVI